MRKIPHFRQNYFLKDYSSYFQTENQIEFFEKIFISNTYSKRKSTITVTRNRYNIRLQNLMLILN